MNVIYGVVLVLVLAGPVPAESKGKGPLKARELAERCDRALEMSPQSTELELAKASYCFGYLTGVVETIVLADSGRQLVCMPAHWNMDMMVSMFQGYLREYPERQEEPASDSVASALQWSFPCERKP
jgi:hypothetical protein